MSLLSELFIATLACWRITSLLVREDGPWEVFAKLRHFIGVRYDEQSVPYGKNVIASALTCIWCCSVWVGALMALLIKPVYLRTWTLYFLALSTGAILIDEIINKIMKE